VTATSGTDGKATVPVTSSKTMDSPVEISAKVGNTTCGTVNVKWRMDTYTVDVPNPKEGEPITGTTDAPDGSQVVVTDDEGNEIPGCSAADNVTVENGTFSCTPTTPLQPGDHINVEVTDPVTGNSGSDDATIEEDPVVDSEKSRLTVSPTEVTQGDRVGIKVETKNAEDRPLPNKPIEVTVPNDWTCTGLSGSGTPVGTDAKKYTVRTNSQGVWESQCTTESSGTKVVKAENPADTDADKNITGSPATVTVTTVPPWDVDIDQPKEGDEEITGSTDAPPGTPVVITGPDKDGDGQPDWTCETTVKSDGTFECDLDEPLGPGDDIHVEVDPDSPKKGEADAETEDDPKVDSDKSKLTVTPRDPVIDDPITVKVETKNAEGRPVPGPIDVTIPEEWTCTDANGANVPTGTKQTITTNDQGLWQVTCTSKIAGDYQVKAENPADTDGDKNINGSPANVTVQPGAPVDECDPQEGKTTGPGTTLTKDPAGPIHPDGDTAYTVTLTAKDKYCNVIPNLDVTWTKDAKLTAKGTPQAVTDNNGQATAQYTSLTENLDPGWPVKAKVVTIEKSVNLTFDGAPTPPVINVANGDEISGTVSDPDANEVEVTYPKEDGTEGTITCPVDKATMTWSCETPGDAVDGPIQAVTVDDGGQRSEPTNGDLDKTPPEVIVNPIDPSDTEVTGTVNDGGKPLPNAPVTVTDEEGNNLCKNPDTVVTDSNGNFTCELNRPLNPGEKVIVTAEDPAGNRTQVEETVSLPTEEEPQYQCDGIEKSTQKNTSVALEVQDHLAECIDGGQAPWVVTAYEDPEHGTLSESQGASLGFGTFPGGVSEVTYTPETDWTGVDSHSITVTDANGAEIPIPVTVTVGDGTPTPTVTTTTTVKVKTGGDMVPGTLPWAAAGLALSGLMALALAGAARRRRQES
jgi:hypothetical protein